MSEEMISKKTLRQWLTGRHMKNVGTTEKEFIEMGKKASEEAKEIMDFLIEHNCLNPQMEKEGMQCPECGANLMPSHKGYVCLSCHLNNLPT